MKRVSDAGQTLLPAGLLALNEPAAAPPHASFLPSFLHLLLPGVWTTSFLTLDVLALRPGTTTRAEVGTRTRSTWTTGVCC